MNTREDAEKLVKFLSRNGIQSKIIGSLEFKESSEHDIDILLTSTPERNCLEDRPRLKDLINHTLACLTDWGGLFLYGTEYGNIDIFFTAPRIGAIEA